MCGGAMTSPKVWLLGITALAAIAVIAVGCVDVSPSAAPTATADPALADLVITMTRGAYPAEPAEDSCRGPCPDYSLTIRGDGSVEYEGFQNVDTVGTQRAQILQEDVSLLLRRFEESGFFELPEDFHCQVLGVGATVMSVRLGDREHGIERCHTSDKQGRLAALEKIEQLIDELTDSARWTGPPRTPPSS